MDGAGVEPHQVAWTLDEPVDGHVGLVQVLQVGPPRAHQEVDVVPGGEIEKGEAGSTLALYVTHLPSRDPRPV